MCHVPTRSEQVCRLFGCAAEMSALKCSRPLPPSIHPLGVRTPLWRTGKIGLRAVGRRGGGGRGVGGEGELADGRDD